MSAFSTPILVQCGPQTYSLSPLTQELQDQYALWCERYAWDCLQHTRPNCSAQDYAILLCDHQRLKREQEFELGPTTYAQKMLGKPDGSHNFVRLALAPYHQLSIEQIAQLYKEYKADFDAAFAQMWLQKKTGGSG